MGITQSAFFKRNSANYDCPMCKLTGKTPNMLGKFNIINDKEYQCNSCDTVYKREICSTCNKLQMPPYLGGYFYLIKHDGDCNCKT